MRVLLAAAFRLRDANIGEQVIIPLTMTQPEFTAAQLKELLFRDLLGAQMTYYAGSTAERINNIRLAAAKLDGLILLPGESFSYNEVVGKRTEEAGFQYADAYSDGQVVPELGGGICQVSSTLYSASLYARMKILSRTNHYFKVGYLDYGMDATVSWGGPDYKFRNDRELPVKIAAYLNEDESSLVVELWGTDFDGIKVQLRTVVEPVYDSEYTDVQIGNSVKTFGDLYDANGVMDVDDKNPDKSLRNTPADKIVLFTGLKYNAKKQQWDGTKIYDPNRGIKVSMTAAFDGPKVLKIRGSVLGIGETEVWKRVE